MFLQSPKLHKPWKDVLVADKEKPACIQYNYNTRKRQSFGIYGVEDCLYLDVFTPNVKENAKYKHPVIVFLYNEQFRNSYNKSLDYGPDFFIEEGVIVVTISHRLSVLGFMSLEDDILPGNSGLKDIVMALEWVNNNIVFFGGDNSRITLMGAQGGATAIDILLHSSAKNLFHGAILQSGTSWTTQYFQSNTRKRAFQLAKVLNKKSSNSKKLIKQLNDAPIIDLLKNEWNAMPQDFYKEEQKSLLPFGPVVEIPTNNTLILATPENTNYDITIPLLIGGNSREGIEGAFQYLIEPRYLSFVEKDFSLHLPRRVNFRFDPEYDGYYQAVNEIKKFYFTEGKVKIEMPDEIVTYLGDVLSTYAVDYTVRYYANKSSENVFYYHFDYSSDLNENKNDFLKEATIKHVSGAATGDELCYLYKCSRLNKKYLEFNKMNSKEIIMQRKLIELWANFAKYG